ncbi:tRNA (adenosine(37)-N6)-dimethylallyltransferase MiaA [bacterium]|nr:tRNA (adenosine(37)-N6)-dimethylallyltransferase MiaA [bacterium]
MKNKLIVLLGPTASGKSKLAVKLAKKFNGEIVSADSRQVYKEMLIGTASPAQEAQKPNLVSASRKKGPILIEKIPHYMLHIVYPNENFNAAIYKKLAVKIIRDIQKRGKLPFLVGGTGLYISVIVDNLKLPKVPPNRKLRKNLEKKSLKELFEIYKKIDPEGAERIDKQNKRRLIRAIEVSKISGKPFWKQREKSSPMFETLQIGIKLDKDLLKKRIEKRTEKMFKNNLEEEVKNLVKKYGWVPALDSIGYYEWKGYLEGKKTKKQVRKEITLHSLQYAKRQMTWFKKDKRIYWIKNYKEAEDIIKNFLKS